MKSTIDESRDVTVTDMGESISVFVPISWKRTGGRKQIILPGDVDAGEQTEEKPSPLAIALARAYVWQKWIDEGEYENAKGLAHDIGMDPAVVRRVLRLGGLSPRVVENIIDGAEMPACNLLNMDVPILWAEMS